MTIVEKSDQQLPAEDSKKATLSVPPPAYDDVISPPSAPTGGTNCISVAKGNGSIKGFWSIDTSLEVPTSITTPSSSASDNHNLSLRTKNGGVDAEVALISGTNDRATILLETLNGTLKCNLVSRVNNQPFRIRLKTINGGIVVLFPRTFIGPIRHDSPYGGYEFSKEIEGRLRVISDKCSFLGSWEESGFVDFEQWKGDEIEASTRNGSIKFSYYDPTDPSKACVSKFKP